MLKNYLNLIVGKQNILRKKKNKHILTKKCETVIKRVKKTSSMTVFLLVIYFRKRLK